MALAIPELVVVRSKEFALQVDGRDFPWRIGKEGPTVRKLADRLFAVKVAILVQERFEHIQPVTGEPVIDGRRFEWPILASNWSPGVIYRASRTSPVTVRLAFLARKVDSDDYIIDIDRPDAPAVEVQGRRATLTPDEVRLIEEAGDDDEVRDILGNVWGRRGE